MKVLHDASNPWQPIYTALPPYTPQQYLKRPQTTGVFTTTDNSSRGATDNSVERTDSSPHCNSTPPTQQTQAHPKQSIYLFPLALSLVRRPPRVLEQGSRSEGESRRRWSPPCLEPGRTRSTRKGRAGRRRGEN